MNDHRYGAVLRPKSKKATSRLRRWVKRGLWCAAILVLLTGGVIAWALTTCFAEPPTLDEKPATQNMRLAIKLVQTADIQHRYSPR